MIVLRVTIIAILLSFAVTGCATTDQRIAALEAKVQKLDKVADYLAHYEPECDFPGKRQHTKFECNYRLTIVDKDKEGKNTAYGTLPKDVIDFHAANCRNYKADLPDGFLCPETDDYKNLKWFFKIDTSSVENNQTYNLISNKGERSLRLHDNQDPPKIDFAPMTGQ